LWIMLTKLGITVCIFMCIRVEEIKTGTNIITQLCRTNSRLLLADLIQFTEIMLWQMSHLNHLAYWF